MIRQLQENGRGQEVMMRTVMGDMSVMKGMPLGATTAGGTGKSMDDFMKKMVMPSKTLSSEKLEELEGGHAVLLGSGDRGKPLHLE